MSDAELHIVVATAEGLRKRFAQAYELGLAMLNAGQRVELKVTRARDPIRATQRKFLKDVVCAQIAEQASVNGVRFTKQIWAEYFRARFLGSRFDEVQTPNDPEPHVVETPISSESLGVKGYSEHTDLVIDTAIEEFKVVFHFTAQEREEVRYRERLAQGAMQ